MSDDRVRSDDAFAIYDIAIGVATFNRERCYRCALDGPRLSMAFGISTRVAAEPALVLWFRPRLIAAIPSS